GYAQGLDLDIPVLAVAGAGDRSCTKYRTAVPRGGRRSSDVCQRGIASLLEVCRSSAAPLSGSNSAARRVGAPAIGRSAQAGRERGAGDPTHARRGTADWHLQGAEQFHHETGISGPGKPFRGIFHEGWAPARADHPRRRAEGQTRGFPAFFPVSWERKTGA